MSSGGLGFGEALVYRPDDQDPLRDLGGKTRITIMIDDDVIEGYRAKTEAAGRGYQTVMILRAAPAEDDRPVTAKMLRKILREELRAP
jgi:hypothetical protein